MRYCNLLGTRSKRLTGLTRQIAMKIPNMLIANIRGLPAASLTHVYHNIFGSLDG